MGPQNLELCDHYIPEKNICQISLSLTKICKYLLPHINTMKSFVFLTSPEEISLKFQRILEVVLSHKIIKKQDIRPNFISLLTPP